MYQEQGITYTWNNIDVSVEEKPDGMSKWFPQWCPFRRKKLGSSTSTPKMILKNVSGEVRPRELLALMGPSGAGKTTLLNALTLQNEASNVQVTGQRRMNGQPVNQTILSSTSGYIQQNDLFIGTLTVREQLIFQALVRMDNSIPRSRRLQRVEEVISEFGLNKCADTMIGVVGRLKGISGGEKKRLAFACEVLTDPQLLFCDEPTSGLDSFMALSVVQAMKSMADRGKSIVATIHQPSSQVYSLFDRMLLLSDGQIVFCGSPQEAFDFFASQGIVCPPNYNPSDFFVDQVTVKQGCVEACRGRIETLRAVYQEQEDFKSARRHSDSQAVDVKEEIPTAAVKDGGPSYNMPWTEQFGAVLWRSWLSVRKDPIVLKIRFAHAILLSLICGSVYFGQKFNQEGVMNISGALVMLIGNMSFQNMIAVATVFCEELPVFLLENSMKMYRTDVYFLSKTLADLPIFVIAPVTYTCIAYYLIGLNPDIQRFIMCVVIIVLVANSAVSFGYMISCMNQNIKYVFAMSDTLITIFLIFGGFFLNVASIPVYFSWVKYMSFYFYANEALNVNQWAGVDNIECGPPGTPCQPDGTSVLHSRSFSESNFYLDIACLLALIIACRLIALLCLMARTYHGKCN